MANGDPQCPGCGVYLVKGSTGCGLAWCPIGDRTIIEVLRSEEPFITQRWTTLPSSEGIRVGSARLVIAPTHTLTDAELYAAIGVFKACLVAEERSARIAAQTADRAGIQGSDREIETTRMMAWVRIRQAVKTSTVLKKLRAMRAR